MTPADRKLIFDWFGVPDRFRGPFGMAIRAAAQLNGKGKTYANSLIDGGKVDKTSSWSFSADDGNALLGPDGDDWESFGKCHLGVDTAETVNTKAHWKYPFAKGGKLYRSALTAIRSRASQQGDTAVFDAAGALLDRIDKPDDSSTARIHQFVAGRSRGSRALNYRMAAKGADAADIYLYDTIGGWGISAEQFKNDLKALGAPKTIDLRVNSDGGDVFAGRAIYTQLAQHSARVVAHVDGVAASIASLICMAADEIRMADGAFMMIHNAWSFTIGNAAEHQRMVDLLNSVDGTVQETYAARTGQSLADIKKWCADETWMTAAEAVARGFADVKDEPVKVAAALRDPSRFRNLPAQLRPRRTAAVAAIAAMTAAVKP